MMKTVEERNELLDLAELYVEGRLDAEQGERLDGWLRKDAEARKIFVAYLHDHAALYWRQVSSLKMEDVDVVEEFEGQPRRLVKMPSWWLAAACVVLISAMAFLFWSPRTEGEVDVVASVFKAEAGSVLKKGDLYEKGETLRMEEGQAEFIFKETGVHVIATAPFEITFGGKDWLGLKEGSLELDVPKQGIGFVVKTEDRVITDLGTRFVVSAQDQGTRVLVFEGEVRVEEEELSEDVLLKTSETGLFKKEEKGKVVKRDDLSLRKESSLPELSLPKGENDQWALKGRIFTLLKSASASQSGDSEVHALSHEFHDLIASGFKDDERIGELEKGSELRFGGIAGHYYGYPLRNGFPSYQMAKGWMAWYQGRVVAPEPGRYRFWGVADNHLLVSVDGKAVFEGGYDRSSLRDRFGVRRTRHPQYPFHTLGGMIASDWFEVGEEGLRLDLLFGESDNHHTVGILMIEKEGKSYEESYWGQPKWPLFLTEWPRESRLKEIEELKGFLENEMKGSFSVRRDALWRVKKD